MNIFYQIVASAVTAMDKFDVYDIALQEIHHRKKADSPSGTALTLSQIILQHTRGKKEVFHEPVHGNQTGTASCRFHACRQCRRNAYGDIRFGSGFRSAHTCAKNRSGFALGALIAAEWLKGKNAVYTQ